MKYLPQVTNASYQRDYIIRTTFDDGTVKSVDFSAWLHGPVFSPLIVKSYFKKFFLDGGTFSWPNGADIAPEALYQAEPVKARDNQRLQLTARKRRI